MTGDFGMSIATRRPVFLEVTGALANTGMLAMFAVPIAFFTGYAMGAVAGCFPGRWVDRVVTGTAVLGVSLPNYWLGIVLVIVFAVELMVLPATGMGPSGSADFRILHWGDAKYLILPVVTLSMIPVGILVAHDARPRLPRCATRISSRPCAPRGSQNGRSSGTC